MIRDSNPDFRINPDADPDVYQIALNMYWNQSFFGGSHCAKYRCRENRPITV